MVKNKKNNKTSKEKYLAEKYLEDDYPIWKESIIKNHEELEKKYNDILQGKYKGYKLDNKIYKIKNIYKETVDGIYRDYLNDYRYNYYLLLEDNKGNEKYIKYNSFIYDNKENLIKRLSLLWKIKNFWHKNNPVVLYKSFKVKNNFDNDINEMLYIGGCIEENPYKKNNKSSLKDKLEWFGHNLLHCHCSDKEEESCDIDIDEIIKNNSYEGIKEYEKEKDELFKLQEQVRSILGIMDNKEYPTFEYKGNYQPYYSDKWVKRLTELGYKGYVKEDLERFIRDSEKNIRKSLYEIDIKDRRQGNIGD